MSAVRTRSDRQKKYLQDVIAGKQPVQNFNDSRKFVRAILAQIDHSVAAGRLMASPSALTALQEGLRFSTTADFINQYTAKLLQYLSDPGIKTLCNGQFLERILVIVLELRTLWNAWMEAFASRTLDDDAIYALAWMMTNTLLTEVLWSGNYYRRADDGEQWVTASLSFYRAAWTWAQAEPFSANEVPWEHDRLVRVHSGRPS